MSVADKAFCAFGFLLSVAYLPDSSGASVPPRYAVIGAGLALLLMVGRVPLTRGLLLWLSFCSWATLTTLWVPVSADAGNALLLLTLLTGMMLLGSAVETLEPFFTGLALGIGVNSALAIAQWYGWTGIIQLTPSPAGLFLNRNTLGETATLALIGVALGQGRWRVPLALVCLPSVLLVHSRASMAGLAAAGGVWLWRRSPAAAVALGAVLAFLCLNLFGDGYRAASTAMHIDIARDAISGLKPFGNGIGSFLALFPAVAHYVDASAIAVDHAHNDVLEILFELGLPGVLLASLFILECVRETDCEREKLVLIAFLATGCFSFPLYLPATGCIFALVAGHLGRVRPMVWRDVYCRGMALLHRIEIGRIKLRIWSFRARARQDAVAL